MNSTEHTKYNYLLMLGHLSTDINQGALLAVMPFLVLNQNFSYTAVAIMVFASNVISAVVQPLFGRLGDRVSCPWIMSLGILLAGFGMAGVGLLDSYPLIVASAMVSGVGIAMFHPEGGRLANLCAGSKKGNGMSIFAVGGNLGFMVGPMMIAVFVSFFGMAGTAIFVVHSVLCALLLLVHTKIFKSFGLVDAASLKVQSKERWGAFSIALGALSFRSVLFNTLLTFVPLFLVANLGQTEAFGSMAITLYALFGAVATFFSGRISAKTGAQRLLIMGMFALVVILIGFQFCHSLWFALILLVLAAPAVNGPYPSTVALAQGFVPRHLGMASGLTYGVAVGVGGMFSPVMGFVGDSFGLLSVFALATVFAFCGLVLACVLFKISGNSVPGKN